MIMSWWTTEQGNWEKRQELCCISDWKFNILLTVLKLYWKATFPSFSVTVSSKDHKDYLHKPSAELTTGIWAFAVSIFCPFRKQFFKLFVINMLSFWCTLFYTTKIRRKKTVLCSIFIINFSSSPSIKMEFI